jgi:hypothetical protein
MAFSHGTTARFYLHTLDYSGYTEAVGLALSRALAEYRPLNAEGVQRVPGHRDGTVALTGGALDSTAGANDADAWARINEDTPRPWAYLPAGDVFGRPAYCGLSLGDNQQRVAGDDIVRLPVALVNTGTPDRGVILRALAAGGISPGASHNHAAATANGGAAYLLCTALSGVGAELVVTFEHSTNGVDWDTLVAMTALEAVGSEQKIVAPGTTVRQYLRVSWALTGTATWFAAFCRR